VVEHWVPGPGSYNVEKPIGKDSIKISLSHKLNKSKSDTSFSDIPGPGAYRPATSIKHEGKYLISKYRNDVDVKFGKAKRFEKERYEDVPGPGTYKQISSFNHSGNGYQFLSNMKSSNGRSLLWKNTPKVKMDDFPGPGLYKIPSEFGVYISKNASKNDMLSYKGLRACRTHNSSLVVDGTVNRSIFLNQSANKN